MAKRPRRNHTPAFKAKLGERGPAWWTDGAPDLNRHLVKNTGYAEWALRLKTAERQA